MPRYFVRPNASTYKPLQAEDTWYRDPLIPSLDVPDHRPVDTGLVDQRGNPIMRAPQPVGFGRDGEW